MIITHAEPRLQPMMPALTFAACYVYSPCGECAISARSRVLCSRLKAGDAHFIPRYAARVRQQASEQSIFAGFFNASDVLIPVPGNEPPPAGITPVTERLAAALVREGLGLAAWTGLSRARAVRKSATAPHGTRPTVREHFDTFSVEGAGGIPGTAQILLVDDVVTKGRTLMAAAARLQEAFPGARIRAFALLRTMGLIPSVNRLLDPCVGQIKWRGGDTHRVP